MDAVDCKGCFKMNNNYPDNRSKFIKRLTFGKVSCIPDGWSFYSTFTSLNVWTIALFLDSLPCLFPLSFLLSLPSSLLPLPSSTLLSYARPSRSPSYFFLFSTLLLLYHIFSRFSSYSCLSVCVFTSSGHTGIPMEFHTRMTHLFVFPSSWTLVPLCTNPWYQVRRKKEFMPQLTMCI